MAAPTPAPRPTPPQAMAISVVLVTVVAIASGLLLQVDRRPVPVPSPSAAAASPGASPGASPTPAVNGDWAALEVGDLPVIATLEPARRDVAGIAPDTTFTLASRSDEPAATIAERLRFSPVTTLKVVPSADGRTATLTPDRALVAGRTYRVGLRTAAEMPAGSWAFRVRGPVTAVSTLPGDATTGVPVNTGVEITFDQDDVAAMDGHFKISPAVKGRFERHGRTQVFVPDKLAPATLYTVTVDRDLGRTGTDLTLAADVVVRFETEATGAATPTRLRFSRDVIEVGPKVRPVVAVTAIMPESADGTPGPAPRTARVKVYRLADLDKAAGTLAAFLDAPRWGDFSDPLMPVAGLPIAASFEAALEPLAEETLLLRFPAALAEGRYIVELSGARRSHAFLQVTPLSAWVSVSTDRTVVWLNDVTTGRGVPGTSVAVQGGPSLGRANADGLLIAPTPALIVPPPAADPEAAVPPSSPILRATSPAGKVLLIPFGVQGAGEGYRGEWSEKSAAADATYWAVMASDRGIYRRDDKIEVWGYLRGRDDGAVPTSVDVRLVTNGGGRTPGAPVIATVNVRPGPDGSFTASLPVGGLPFGGYEVQAAVADRLIVGRFVEVTVIRKPPYALSLTPDRNAVLSGEAVTFSGEAAFFDGSPVPSLDVRFQVEGEEEGRLGITDAAGAASLSVKLESDQPTEASMSRTVSITPAGPEGAEMSAYRQVVVFTSAYDLDASGEVADGRLRVSGTLHAVDLAKVERALAAGGWDGDAAGAPIGATRISASIVELVPVRRQVGKDYDFINKVVTPRYEYDIERKSVGSRTVVTDADGRLAFDLAVPHADNQYEITLSATDEAGRLQQRTVSAGQPYREIAGQAVVFEETTGVPAGETAHRIGDRLTWRMSSGGKAFPSGGDDRYLYIVSQRGLRSATVTDSATFRHTFASADAPGIFVIGVRFTGSTYAPKAAAWANFDQRERALRVTVESDRDRYRPGDTATLSVRTTDASGAPVAAAVVVQAVDEKLYAMGGASVTQPLDELYQRVDSGILRLTATHQVPSMTGPEGEGGDTTGGGRSDFKDTLLFRQIHTDANGRASTTVKLSDDLTSWHVAASAVTADLRAGVAERLVPVGLPFFVEATLADTYLVTDHPVVRLRAFGDGLRVGDPVEFTVEAPSLGLSTTRITGTAFTATSVALPIASAGRVSVVFGATAPSRAGSTDQPLSDRLTRTFDVVASRLTTLRTAYGTGTDLPSLGEATGLTTYTFSDAGRGAVLPLLYELAEPGGVRLDRLLAQATADRVLVDAFGRESGSLPPLTLEPERYSFEGGDPPTYGVALLPWSSPDPWLAARVALTAPDALDRSELRDALRATLRSSTTKRDLTIASLAGLAALDEPVLADLAAASAETNLTTLERLYLALGFAAAGDQPSATAIERDVLREGGERLGAWVRVKSADPEATLETTSLLAVLAADLGDPLATGLARYVMDNPSTESIHDLDLAAWAEHVVEHTPASATSFAYTLDGVRTTVELKAGETLSLVLTDAQRSTLRLEPGTGAVGVTVEGRIAAAPSTLTSHASLKLTRAAPTGAVAADRIVTVNLTATFSNDAPAGCYDVTDLVPSGLAPIVDGYWQESDELGAGVTWPTSVIGQEVRFCADNDARTGHQALLRYRARVVNEGSFTWEPAVMQLPGAPELLAVTPAGSVTVEAP